MSPIRGDRENGDGDEDIFQSGTGCGQSMSYTLEADRALMSGCASVWVSTARCVGLLWRISIWGYEQAFLVAEYQHPIFNIQRRKTRRLVQIRKYGAPKRTTFGLFPAESNALYESLWRGSK